MISETKSKVEKVEFHQTSLLSNQFSDIVIYSDAGHCGRVKTVGLFCYNIMCHILFDSRTTEIRFSWYPEILASSSELWKWKWKWKCDLQLLRSGLRFFFFLFYCLLKTTIWFNVCFRIDLLLSLQIDRYTKMIKNISPSPNRRSKQGRYKSRFSCIQRWTYMRIIVSFPPCKINLSEFFYYYFIMKMTGIIRT